MRIIITGGTGLIGQKLAKDFIDAGHELIILTRNPNHPGNRSSGARYEAWDSKTSQGWGQLVNGTDVIINFAGENIAGTSFFPTRWTTKQRERIQKSRIQAGEAVVQAVRESENKPSLVIQASAIGYYGPQGELVLTETSPAGNDFLAHTCEIWEKSTAEIDEMGVRRAVLRTGIYLSPEGGALARLLLPYKLFAGGPMGSGKQWYSWIHPDDLAGAVQFIIENDKAKGVFNLTAPHPLPNRDFGKALGREMHRPSWIPLPSFILRGLFGDVATVVVDGQRVIPKRLIDMGYTFKFPEIEVAFKELLSE